MKTREIATTSLIILVAVVLTAILATASVGANQSTPSKAAAAAKVERGGYLVWAMGCNDCHTPWKMGQKGPEMDFSRRLSGHPADLKMPAAAGNSAGTVGDGCGVHDDRVGGAVGRELHRQPDTRQGNRSRRLDRRAVHRHDEDGPSSGEGTSRCCRRCPTSTSAN